MNIKISALRARKGFTLVELLVVIAIIGVLATLVLLQLGAARGRARDAKRIADVNQIRGALELYYEDNSGSYPDDIYAATTPLKPYLVVLPYDPLDKTKKYFYSYDSGTRSYQVAAELEQKAAALDADADINESWSEDGTVDQGASACSSNTAVDCLYDLGVVNQ